MPERMVKKSKLLVCGHTQTYLTPVPQEGDYAWCNMCRDWSMIPRRKRKTVAEGRPRRLNPNPKANNKHTKGRKLI